MVFKLVSIIITIIVIISSIVKMNISAKTTKGEGYNALNLEDKRKKVLTIKLFWKKCIVNIAIAIALIFIFISTFMGNESKYSLIIYIGISIISIIQVTVIEIMYKKIK